MTVTFNENDAYVRSVTRRSGSNFYVSFFSLPKDQRQAITAVYAFCRGVDDVVDVPGQEDPKVVLERWKQELVRTYEGNPSWPLTKALAQAIQRFNLSKVYFDGILQGVSMDLTTDRYPTVESLSTYCYHVAGEVGLLCMEIFGYRSPHLKSYAVKLGMAFQLTNILRDVGTDADRNRIYLPQEDLARFGVSEADFLQKRYTPAFVQLMTFESQRARAFYREAAALPKAEEWPALKAAEIMRAVYTDVLDRIEARQFHVFGSRIRVPTLIKIWLALQAWWRCRS